MLNDACRVLSRAPSFSVFKIRGLCLGRTKTAVCDRSAQGPSGAKTENRLSCAGFPHMTKPVRLGCGRFRWQRHRRNWTPHVHLIRSGPGPQCVFATPDRASQRFAENGSEMLGPTLRNGTSVVRVDVSCVSAGPRGYACPRSRPAGRWRRAARPLARARHRQARPAPPPGLGGRTPWHGPPIRHPKRSSGCESN